MKKNIKPTKIRKGSAWEQMNDKEISEIFDLFHENKMIDLFHKYMNMTKEEVDLETLKNKFEILLRDLNAKHYIFPQGWEIESIDGKLYVSEYFFDFEEFPNLKHPLALSDLFYFNKKGYINYEQLIKIIDYVNNPPFKKQPKTVNTYLMTDASGYIKIGKAQDINKRFASLKGGNPTLKIIAYLDKNIETNLHREFASYRILGEWFSLSDAILLDIIKKHKFVSKL
jgi:hypothetical protein